MTVTHDMTGNVAVITGGAQGIGLACARRLSSSGAKVHLFDIDEAALTVACDEIGPNATAHKVNISDPEAVSAAVADAAGMNAGTVSICINSAGISGPNAPLIDYPVDEWIRIINLNLNGTFFVNRAVVPFMKHNGYGRIVNIASVAGKEGNPNAAAYSASKAGVIGLTKSLGKELADLNIAVNCITPAAAKTAIFDQMTDDQINYMLSKIPRQRFVKTDEIAAMVAWLVSRENSFTTASTFDLSGGRATY